MRPTVRNMKARKHRADSTRVDPFWRFLRLAEIGVAVLTTILLDRCYGDTGNTSDAGNQGKLEQRAEGNAGGHFDVGQGVLVQSSAGGRAIDGRSPYGTGTKLGSHGTDARVTSGIVDSR